MHDSKHTNNEYSYNFDLDYSYLSPSVYGNRELEILFNTIVDKIEDSNLNDSARDALHSDIPIAIFRQGISGLQAIVKFLKEEKNLSYAQISRQLSRDQRTIWSSYASVKKFPRLKCGQSEIIISTAIFCSREVSILEAIALFLKESGYSLTESARILDKSPKTLWTVISRAKQKKANQHE